MRFVVIASLALIGCATGNTEQSANGTLDQAGEQQANSIDSQVAGGDATAPGIPQDATKTGTSTGVVIGDNPEDLSGKALDDAPEEGAKPVAVVFVVDQNADMINSVNRLNEPVLAGLRALFQTQDETYVGIVGHADRWSHELYSIQPVIAEDHRLLFGAAGALTTCSTLEDMSGWSQSASNYDNPTLHAPPCWSDETGRDPATAIAFAQHLLNADTPDDAVKAIVMVGTRQPVELADSDRRPDGHSDQMPTWKRTDREVSSEILIGHTEFLIEDLAADGIKLHHVAISETADDQWLQEMTSQTTPGTVNERVDTVHTFIESLRAEAASN